MVPKGKLVLPFSSEILVNGGTDEQSQHNFDSAKQVYML